MKISHVLKRNLDSVLRVEINLTTSTIIMNKGYSQLKTELKGQNLELDAVECFVKGDLFQDKGESKIFYVKEDRRFFIKQTNSIKEGEIWLKDLLHYKDKIVEAVSDGIIVPVYTKMRNFVGLKNEITILSKQDKNFVDFFLDYTESFVVGKDVNTLTNNMKVQLAKPEYLSINNLQISESNIKYVEFFGNPMPVGEAVDRLLVYMANKKISDVSMSARSGLMLRVDKKLRSMPGTQPIEPSDAIALQDYFLDKESKFKQEFYYSHGYTRLTYPIWDVGRFRVTMSLQRGTPTFSIRCLPSEILALKHFNLNKVVKQRLLSGVGGLYVVSGVPNSGKSSLLSAVIEQFTLMGGRKITTLENPIEYLFKHRDGVVNQHEIGEDLKSWDDANTMLMTNDPDIIYLTEIKEYEELVPALQMAASGKTVLTSTHGGSVEETVQRLENMIPSHEREAKRRILYSVLRLVMVQALVPRITGGLIPAHEVLNFNPSVAKTFIDNSTSSIPQLMYNEAENNKNFNNDLFNLWKAGYISEETMHDNFNDDNVEMTGFKEYRDANRFEVCG